MSLVYAVLRIAEHLKSLQDSEVQGRVSEHKAWITVTGKQSSQLMIPESSISFRWICVFFPIHFPWIL